MSNELNTANVAAAYSFDVAASGASAVALSSFSLAIATLTHMSRKATIRNAIKLADIAFDARRESEAYPTGKTASADRKVASRAKGFRDVIVNKALDLWGSPAGLDGELNPVWVEIFSDAFTKANDESGAVSALQASVMILATRLGIGHMVMQTSHGLSGVYGLGSAIDSLSLVEKAVKATPVKADAPVNSESNPATAPTEGTTDQPLPDQAPVTGEVRNLDQDLSASGVIVEQESAPESDDSTTAPALMIEDVVSFILTAEGDDLAAIVAAVQERMGEIAARVAA